MPDLTLPPTLPDAATSEYPELPPEPQGSWFARNRKSVILVGIVVILAVGLGVSALIQGQQARRSNTNSTNTQTVTINTNLPVTTATNRTTYRRYEAIVIPDQDNDGLSDEEEGQVGTTLDDPDSDDDGLTDYDEVKIYRSDPKKSDTDGDGSSDGAEVAAGTNPNGPGPLLDISQAIQQLNNTNQ